MFDIKKYLPTESDRALTRRDIRNFFRWSAILTVVIAAVVLVSLYPIILAIFISGLVLFFVLDYLWAALAPTKKKDKNVR
jgi:chromate transport protein ChrA